MEMHIFSTHAPLNKHLPEYHCSKECVSSGSFTCAYRTNSLFSENDLWMSGRRCRGAFRILKNNVLVVCPLTTSLQDNSWNHYWPYTGANSNTPGGRKWTAINSIAVYGCRFPEAPQGMRKTITSAALCFYICNTDAKRKWGNEPKNEVPSFHFLLLLPQAHCSWRILFCRISSVGLSQYPLLPLS